MSRSKAMFVGSVTMTAPEIEIDSNSTGGGNGNQNRIAGLLAVLLVQRGEVIDVEQGRRGDCRRLRCPRAQVSLEKAAIVNVGQEIPVRGVRAGNRLAKLECRTEHFDRGRK